MAHGISFKFSIQLDGAGAHVASLKFVTMGTGYMSVHAQMFEIFENAVCQLFVSCSSRNFLLAGY